MQNQLSLLLHQGTPDNPRHRGITWPYGEIIPKQDHPACQERLQVALRVLQQSLPARMIDAECQPGGTHPRATQELAPPLSVPFSSLPRATTTEDDVLRKPYRPLVQKASQQQFWHIKTNAAFPHRGPIESLPSGCPRPQQVYPRTTVDLHDLSGKWPCLRSRYPANSSEQLSRASAERYRNLS